MKVRLSILYFLQFSVWGCYLTCFGQLLGAGGLGKSIAWFYAAVGIVSIVSPPLLGRLADKTGYPSRLLGFCHFGASIVMLFLWRYASTHDIYSFNVFLLLYIGFLLLYMPTMALANTTSFSLLMRNGLSAVTTFPHIRIWGTVGFVAAMWFVNSAYWYNGSFGFTLSDALEQGKMRFQYNSMQLLCSGIMGMVTSVFVFISLPHKRYVSDENNITEKKCDDSLLSSLKIFFSNRVIRLFLIFVIFTGVCLQISNGFAIPYINHFSAMSEYVGSLASGNATLLFSLSQISEAFCILLVGYSLNRIGIKWVFGIGILAWSLRFLFLAMGNPGNGLWMLIVSMLVYGLAFNFITIAGHIFIQQVADNRSKGLAQGLMMFMGNGIGATIGVLIAGEIVNHWCTWQMVSIAGSDTQTRLFLGDWVWPWSIFSVYALIILFLWLILFKSRSKTLS